MENDNLDVTKFNLLKKLVQLEKVVQVLQVKLVERAFQAEAVRKSYNLEENKVFEGYESQMKDIEKDFESIEDARSFSRAFSSKYDIISTAFVQKTKIYADDLTESVKNIEQNIKKVEYQIKRINSELEKESKFLTVEFDKSIKEFKENIENINKNAEENKRKTIIENENKLNQTKEDEKKRLKKIKTDYKETIQGMKSNYRKTENDYLKGNVKGMRNWNLKISNMIEDMDNAKFDISEILEKYRKMMKVLIPKKNFVLKNNVINFDGQEKEVESFYDKMKVETSSFELEKQELIKSKEQNRKNFVSTKELRINELIALEHAHKTELNDKGKDLQIMQESNNSSYDEYIANLKKIEEDALIKISNERHIFDKKSESIIHEIETQKKALLDDIEHANDDINDEKVIMEKMLRAENEKFSNTKTILQQKHKNDIEKTEKAMEERSLLVFNFRKAEQEKKMLQSHLDSLGKINQTAITRQNIAEKDEENAIKKMFTKLKNESNEKNTEEYKIKKGFTDKNIDEKRKEMDSIYNEEKQNLIDQEEEEMQNIKDNTHYEDELEALQKKYEDEYTELSKKLEEIEIPKSQSSESLEKVRNELEEKKVKLENDLKEEKSKLIRSFKKEFEAEGTRHSAFLISLLKEPDKEEIIAQTIAKIKNDYMKIINNLDAEVGNKKQELKHYKQLFNAINKSAGDCKEIQELEKEIQHLQREKVIKIEEANKETERTLKEEKEKIENEKQNVLNGKKQADKDSEEEMNEIHRLFNIEITKRKEKRDAVEEAEVQLQNELDEIEKEKNEKQEECTAEINKKIEEERKKFLENEEKRKIEKEEEKEKQDKNIEELKEKQKIEIEELKEMRNTSNPKINEDLEEATKRRDEAKRKCSKKPMRPQEKYIFEHLIEIANQKMSYLAIISRDLLMYRQRLLQQESEVNNRFGKDLIVGDARNSLTTRPRTSYAAFNGSRSLPRSNGYSPSTPRAKKKAVISSPILKNV